MDTVHLTAEAVSKKAMYGALSAAFLYDIERLLREGQNDRRVPQSRIIGPIECKKSGTTKTATCKVFARFGPVQFCFSF